MIPADLIDQIPDSVCMKRESCQRAAKAVHIICQVMVLRYERLTGTKMDLPRIIQNGIAFWPTHSSLHLDPDHALAMLNGAAEPFRRPYLDHIKNSCRAYNHAIGDGAILEAANIAGQSSQWLRLIWDLCNIVARAATVGPYSPLQL